MPVDREKDAVAVFAAEVQRTTFRPVQRLFAVREERYHVQQKRGVHGRRIAAPPIPNGIRLDAGGLLGGDVCLELGGGRERERLAGRFGAVVDLRFEGRKALFQHGNAGDIFQPDFPLPITAAPGGAVGAFPHAAHVFAGAGPDEALHRLDGGAAGLRGHALPELGIDAQRRIQRRDGVIRGRVVEHFVNQALHVGVAPPLVNVEHSVPDRNSGHLQKFGIGHVFSPFCPALCGAVHSIWRAAGRFATE